MELPCSSTMSSPELLCMVLSCFSWSLFLQSLMAFLLVLSQLPMISVGRWVYDKHVCLCVCVCGFCIMPYVLFHIHLTMVTWNLIQARTLHLRSYCIDVNTVKHFMHNSVIIMKLFFFCIVKSCTLIWEKSIFLVSKISVSANLCCQFIFLVYRTGLFFFFGTIHWKP